MKYLLTIAVVLQILINISHIPKSMANSKLESLNLNDHRMSAVLWVQRSANIKALQFQAYNIAKIRLDQLLKNSLKKKKAIIVDIDETVLDNSPFAARLILSKKQFSYKLWQKWVAEEQASAIPGALEFLKYASGQKVEIFYITNRKVHTFQHTFNNLKKLGFPIKKKNLLMKHKISSKQERRNAVSKEYQILLLIGDSMADFSQNYDKGLYKAQVTQATKEANKFGAKFIVLPNPMYGSWEDAIYNFNHKKSDLTKAQDRVKSLDPKDLNK